MEVDTSFVVYIHTVPWSNNALLPMCGVRHYEIVEALMDHGAFMKHDQEGDREFTRPIYTHQKPYSC
jgi:hypothetical protein